MTTPIVTADQLKRFLQLASSEHDVLLADLAERASAFAETFCDRVFAAGTYDPATDPDNALLSGRGLPFVYTPQWPIVAVTELKLVAEGGGAVQQAFTAGQYAVNKRDGKITLLASATGAQLWLASQAPAFPEGTQNVWVKYSAGYATLPADLVEAVLLIAAQRFRDSQQGGSPPSRAGDRETGPALPEGGSIPKAALERLRAYRSAVAR